MKYMDTPYERLPLLPAAEVESDPEIALIMEQLESHYATSVVWSDDWQKRPKANEVTHWVRLGHEVETDQLGFVQITRTPEGTAVQRWNRWRLSEGFNPLG